MTNEIDAAKLKTKQRDALPDSDFAVPGKRALPMHDVTHTKMAWNMLSKTHGLTPEESATAKNRILKRAHEFGIDTKDWNASAEDLEASFTEEQHMQFSGMAVSVPDSDNEHPNKIPFSGVLTRIDEPSDNPLSGSDGKCVILPAAVAAKALSSLLLMAIDFQDDLSGHDAQQKIGLIEEANIIGNEIQIKGFFYGADFPAEVKRIQAEKSRLGFSYEAQVKVRSMADDPLVIIDCVFTGAAVLYKDKAAYTTTSLTANAEKETDMSNEILEALGKLTSKLENLETEIKEVKASAEDNKNVQANSIYGMVKPHADTLHAAAASMEKAGIGLHPSNGHVMALRCMANHMMAEAAQGKMPHVYQNTDFMHAAADKTKKDKKEENTELKAFQAEMDSLKTKLADAEKARFEASANPNRKTLSPEIKTLLANNGNTNPEAEGKLAISVVDKAFQAKGMNVTQRLTEKLLAQANGVQMEAN